MMRYNYNNLTMKEKQSSYEQCSQTYTIKNWTKLLCKYSQSFNPFIQDLFLHPAYGKTHVVAHQLFPNYQVVHFDEKGKKLGVLQFSCNDFFQIGLLSDWYVVLLRGTEGEYGDYLSYQIIIWDLKSHNTCNFPHFCQNKKSAHSGMGLILFKQSKLICICETTQSQSYRNGRNGVVQVNLSYYQLDDEKYGEIYKKVDHKYRYRMDNSLEIQRRTKAIKVNQQSKIAFIHQQDINREYLQIKIYELHPSEIRKGRLRSYKLEHNLQKQLSICSIIATELWELDKDVYYVKLETQLNFSKYLINNQPILQGKYQQVYKQYEHIWKPEQDDLLFPTFKPQQLYYQSQFIKAPRKITNFYRKIPISGPKNIKQKRFDKNQQKLIQFPIYIISRLKDLSVISGKIDTKGTLGINRKQFPVFWKTTATIYELQQYNLKVKFSELRDIQFQQSTAIAFLTLGMITDCDHDLLYTITQLIKKGSQE